MISLPHLKRCSLTVAGRAIMPAPEESGLTDSSPLANEPCRHGFGRSEMRRCLLLICTAVVFLASASSAWAQTTTGDIRGVITDQSGAVLPGVTVTVRGRGVPGAPTAVTNESGIYRFPNPATGFLRPHGGARGLHDEHADGHSGLARRHDGNQCAAEGQHAVRDHHRRRGVTRCRFHQHAGGDQLHARMG